jgi:hypothetical protein
MEYDNNYFIIASRAYSLHLPPPTATEPFLFILQNVVLQRGSCAGAASHVRPSPAGEASLKSICSLYICDLHCQMRRLSCLPVPIGVFSSLDAYR